MSCILSLNFSSVSISEWHCRTLLVFRGHHRKHLHLPNLLRAVQDQGAWCEDIFTGKVNEGMAQANGCSCRCRKKRYEGRLYGIMSNILWSRQTFIARSPTFTSHVRHSWCISQRSLVTYFSSEKSRYTLYTWLRDTNVLLSAFFLNTEVSSTCVPGDKEV